MRAQTLITARTAENALNMLAERVDCRLVYTGILSRFVLSGSRVRYSSAEHRPAQQTTDPSARNRHERSLPVDATVNTH